MSKDNYNMKSIIAASLFSVAALSSISQAPVVSAEEATAPNIETVDAISVNEIETPDTEKFETVDQPTAETTDVETETAQPLEEAPLVEEVPNKQPTHEAELADNVSIDTYQAEASELEHTASVAETTEEVIVEDTTESWNATNPVPTEVRQQTEEELLSDESFEEEGSRFSIAVLPDTQFYSRYGTEQTGNQFQEMYGSEPFNSQTQWIVDNDEKYNIEMTLHLGDVVDRSNQTQEWEVADEAMKILEDGDHSYSIIAGNHDIGGETLYDEYTETFSPERASLNETLVERDPTGAHEYHLFNVDDQEFAVLGLSWDADAEALTWANDLLEKKPDTPTILTSHQLVNIETDTQQAAPTDFGEYIWNNVIENNNQIFMTFNGHHHGATSVQRENAYGNPVTQVLMDYQMAYMGGNGYMGLVEFDLTNDKIHLTSFSPWVMEKDPTTLVTDDQALLKNTTESFTIDLDFDERFPDLTVGEPNDPSYTQEIRSTIFENFESLQSAEPSLPTNENDYPVVEGTVAHWRFPANQEGQTVEVGGVIQDITNPENSFYRAPLNIEGIQGAELDDVYFTADHHPLSSNKGSVRFEGGSRNNSTGLGYKTASYFRTQEDAPINFEEFEDGYTFETFVKFDPSFTVEDNEWMQWLVREGKREGIPGYPGSEGDEPPFAWALSNLKEVQFSFVDSQDEPTEQSNWSGEIVNLEEWYHLAVVNDPETKTAVMYVNGIPVLRNAIDTAGIASTGEPWSLGAGLYDSIREAGFIGWIGETRLVDRPLNQSVWLIARAPIEDESADIVTPPQEENVTTPPVTEDNEAINDVTTPSMNNDSIVNTDEGTDNAVKLEQTATKTPSGEHVSKGQTTEEGDIKKVASLPKTGSAMSLTGLFGIMMTTLGTALTFRCKRK